MKAMLAHGDHLHLGGLHGQAEVLNKGNTPNLLSVIDEGGVLLYSRRYAGSTSKAPCLVGIAMETRLGSTTSQWKRQLNAARFSDDASLPLDIRGRQLSDLVDIEKKLIPALLGGNPAAASIALCAHHYGAGPLAHCELCGVAVTDEILAANKSTAGGSTKFLFAARTAAAVSVDESSPSKRKAEVLEVTDSESDEDEAEPFSQTTSDIIELLGDFSPNSRKNIRGAMSGA
jgi:hypothetical protein